MTGAQETMFRRIERRAIVLTIVAMVVAFFVPGGRWRGAAAVAGGALVIGTSYLALRRGMLGVSNALIAPSAARRRSARAVVVMLVRYALLAVMAYVMIARLRLPLIGLLCGASVIPVAAGFELSRRQA